VVNYDLPWNPQRIEQRIGRCHRYGQQHDVVVVNFLNRRNAADQRVFQLLSQKFRLFDGVFGASDEVLGALESGVDLEKRIAQVYQRCRTTEDIQAAFDKLQADLDAEIGARMADTHKVLLENFDEDVRARLRIRNDEAHAVLSERQRWLHCLAVQELPAQPDEGTRLFHLDSEGKLQFLNFVWQDADRRNEAFFHVDHPVAKRLIESAGSRDLPYTRLIFEYSSLRGKIALLEQQVGHSGYLSAVRLFVRSFVDEEFIVLAGLRDDGEMPPEDFFRKLLSRPACSTKLGDLGSVPPALDQALQAVVSDRLSEVSERNGKHFDEEVSKLDRWSEDLKLGLEQEIKELDRGIRDARRQSVTAIRLEEKLEAQKTIKALEVSRNSKRRELFTAQDRIDAQRDELISGIEVQMQQQHEITLLFTIRWTLED
jgi:hypothetical protein